AADFIIVNTMLSELAVLGFEYGFSSADPRNLCIWEAQFGDFVNGAQPIIDQFLAGAESKWQKFCGLVMLLPHGYEGQGPEHSNAYVERFLSLCAENNLQVVQPTLPSQYFHLLRRQMKRNFRKPLVAFVRVEQLYPFARNEIQAILKKYSHAQEVVWVQDEPRNRGAWMFMEDRLQTMIPETAVLKYVGREEASSPATGSYKLHEIEAE